jgi:hypothetical protein
MMPLPACTCNQAVLNKAVQLLAEEPSVQAREACVVAVCPGWCR